VVCHDEAALGWIEPFPTNKVFTIPTTNPSVDVENVATVMPQPMIVAWSGCFDELQVWNIENVSSGLNMRVGILFGRDVLHEMLNKFPGKVNVSVMPLTTKEIDSHCYYLFMGGYINLCV